MLVGVLVVCAHQNCLSGSPDTQTARHKFVLWHATALACFIAATKSLVFEQAGTAVEAVLSLMLPPLLLLLPLPLLLLLPLPLLLLLPLPLMLLLPL